MPTIERFDWKALGYAPPKYCKVERANDQFLILRREREKFVEQLVIGKIGANNFVLFRVAVSLGEMLELTDNQIVMTGPLAGILAAVGYNCRIDKLAH